MKKILHGCAYALFIPVAVVLFIVTQNWSEYQYSKYPLGFREDK